MARDVRIRNIIKGLNPFDEKVRQEFSQGVQDDFSIGREDRQLAFYALREGKGLQKEAPKVDSLLGTNQLLTRLQEATGLIDPVKKQALKDKDIALEGSLARKAGQFVGTLGNDIVSDGTRAIYWLINAPQASAEIIQEKVTASRRLGEPELYGRSPVYREKGTQALNRKGKGHLKEMERRGLVKPRLGKDGKMNYEPRRGYSFNDAGDLEQRNYSPGSLTALAVPTGVAINSALGLLTPFGGAEGYKAAVPSEEDPTKTDNAVLEVAMKYLMGRTGNLLPYDEFSQVRPDVSPSEYGQYQAYKYNKKEDWNPLDGDFNILGGFLKGETEGIHGPEVAMFGRSVPLSTGILPAAGAILGTAQGARIGHRKFDRRGALGGFIGGMTGLGVSTAAGNIIEGERRRRNALENEGLL